MSARALICAAVGAAATGCTPLGLLGAVIGYVLVAAHDRSACRRARAEAFSVGRAAGLSDAEIDRYCHERLPRGGL